MAIDPYSTYKAFKVIDDDTGAAVYVSMLIIDIIKFKQNAELISVLRRGLIRG